MNDLQFRLWALQQDNLRRAENIDRARDENYRALLTSEYERTENEIAALRETLSRQEV